MEYATTFAAIEQTNNTVNSKNMQHVGYTESQCERDLFSKNSIAAISNKITQLLDGLYSDRRVAVHDDAIISVLSSISDAYVPPVGDIYSRYTIPNDQSTGTVNIIDRTIGTIVSQVRNEVEIGRYNASLTKWTTVLGDFNEHGIRSHPRIKLREKRPAPMLFNMNY
jgi:hypothetical protein